MAREYNNLIKKACDAMRELGIDEKIVKPVLKKLLKEFYNNWQLIEKENYRDLISAIFDIANQQRNKLDEEPSGHRSTVSWEHTKIISRDGKSKLKTNVLLASIDQRSKGVSGESVCSALVAIFAEWLQNNNKLLPIKSEFDSLIVKVYTEWRKLLKNKTYRERFHDGYFDLETILQSKICSISVLPEKSFIGFFHPDVMEEGIFDVHQGTTSFDYIWEEISRECKPQVYIINWNDYFFILKASPEAYYIMDSLGERLYEGCNQAYILKFDHDSMILKLEKTNPSSQEKMNNESSLKEKVICGGKESCNEYIKSFLAAIPIRDLQENVKKGSISSILAHQRLQIEFHFTKLQHPTIIDFSSSSDNPSIVEKLPLTIERNRKRRRSSGAGPSNTQFAGSKRKKL